MARYIGFTVFSSGGDIRDVMSVGKLYTRHEEFKGFCSLNDKSIA